MGNDPFAWPKEREGAVSLRFDDGMDSHLQRAVPLLESHGLRGTFYICPGGSDDQWDARVVPWKAVLQTGHEVGNHTMRHPIPAALTDRAGPKCYENLSMEHYAADVLGAQERLERTLGRRPWTFCYPCYQTWIGRGPTCRSVVPFVAGHFVAAVAGGEISRPFNDPRSCDLHLLLSLRGALDQLRPMTAQTTVLLEVAEAVRAHTPADAPVAIVHDWARVPEVFYYADRRGWSLWLERTPEGEYDQLIIAERVMTPDGWRIEERLERDIERFELLRQQGAANIVISLEKGNATEFLRSPVGRALTQRYALVAHAEHWLVYAL